MVKQCSKITGSELAHRTCELLWFCVYTCESECTKTYMEGKLSREVIHAAGVHEAEGVSHGLWAQHTLACDWTEASIGQCGSHDASALTRDLDGAQLHIWTQTQINTWIRNIIKPGCQITVFISTAFLMDFTENNILRIWPCVCVFKKKPSPALSHYTCRMILEAHDRSQGTESPYCSPAMCL